MADKFLQGLAGFLQNGLPAFLQGQEINRRRRDDAEERRRYDERTKRDDARYDDSIARQERLEQRADTRYNEGLVRQDQEEKRKLEEGRRDRLAGTVMGDASQYEKPGPLMALAQLIQSGAKPGQFTQPGASIPGPGYGLVPDNFKMDPSYNLEKSYGIAGRNNTQITQDGLTARHGEKLEAQKELAKQRALAMSGDKDAGNWVKAALAAEAQGRTPEEAVRIANAYREISRGEAGPPMGAPMMDAAPAPPNPFAGLLGGSEGMAAAGEALGVPQQQPEHPLAGLGQSPKFQRETKLADSLMQQRTDTTDIRRQGLDIQRGRVAIAKQSAKDLAKYRQDRLKEDRLFHRELTNWRSRTASTGEKNAETMRIRALWDQENDALQALLAEKRIDNAEDAQEAMRLGQNVGGLNAMMRTIIGSAMRNGGTLDPALQEQLDEMLLSKQNIEDELFSTLGKTPVRNDKGAVTGFQPKAGAPDKFGFTQSDYATIKALQKKHGISYEAAANAVRNDNKGR